MPEIIDADFWVDEERASRLPLAVLCPASRVEPKVKVLGLDEGARLGTAFHAVIARWIHIGGPTPESISEAAFDEDVDPDELAPLSYWGWNAWQTQKHHFPNPETEKEISTISYGLKLTGHLDLIDLSRLPEEIRILDWKSGRLDSDHSEQIRGYAYLAARQWPQVQKIMGMVLKVRDRQIDVNYYTPQELEEWFARTASTLTKKDQYRAGEHCRYCPRALECGACHQVLTSAMTVLLDGPLDALPTDPLQLGTVLAGTLAKIKMLTPLLKKTDEFIRALVGANGGRLPVEGGLEIALDPQKVTKILPAAYPLLQAMVDENDLENSITIGKGKLSKAVMARAGKGQKGKAVESLMEQLRQEEMLQVDTREKLVVRKPILEIEGDENGQERSGGVSGDGTVFGEQDSED